MASLAQMFAAEQAKQKSQDTGGVLLWKVEFRANKETGKSRVRFLTDFDGGIVMKWHKSKNKEYGEYGISTPCWKDEHFDFETCEYCDSTDRQTRNNTFLYIWPVWDYEENMVRLVTGKNNPKTLAGKLFDLYEEAGSLVGRDFTIKLNGMDYSITPSLKETPFQFEGKVKAPKEEAIIRSLVLARGPELAKAMEYVPADSIVKPSEKKDEAHAGNAIASAVNKRKNAPAVVVHDDDEGVEVEVPESLQPEKKAPVKRAKPAPKVETSDEISFEDED